MRMGAFSAFGSLWLALIVIAIAIVLDLRLLGAGRALGRGSRAGSEHRRRRERRERDWREGTRWKNERGNLAGRCSVTRVYYISRFLHKREPNVPLLPANVAIATITQVLAPSHIVAT